MTLAWPGWKQSVIAVEVDTGRLETSRFKKCYANCVLLYFPSTEIKSAFNTGRQLPPLSFVLYGIISGRRSVLAAELFLREKSGA